MLLTILKNISTSDVAEILNPPLTEAYTIVNLGLTQKIFFFYFALKRESKTKSVKRQTRGRTEHVSKCKLKTN